MSATTNNKTTTCTTTRTLGVRGGLAAVLKACQQAGRLALGVQGGHGTLHQLEERSLLSTAPLPSLSLLENPNHTVVRMETTFGDVDIELFDTVVQTTVDNFINYVRKGQYSETFFHRAVKRVSGQSLIDIVQGGGFSYSNTGGITQMPTDPPIALQYNRPNAERTIAMARTQQPNTATGQWFINTLDNSVPLGNGPGGVDPNGYAVFGRVIQGWDAMLAIRNLPTRDINNDPATGDFGGPNGAFTDLPITPDYNQNSGLRENAVAGIINMEVIKPRGFTGFYTSQLVMPEGWRSEVSSETVEIFNPNSVAVEYQLYSHYEVGGKNTNFEDGSRDRVVSSGSIAANSRVQVRLSERGATNFTSPVRLNEGYSLVLQYGVADGVTGALPLAADIIRTDFNAQASESFINLDSLSTQQRREWTFPRIERNALSKEFLTFWNPSPADAPITIDFVTPEGPRTFNITLNPYRRGGFALEDQGLAEGILSARIRSTVDITVTLSDWDLADAGQDVSRTYMPGFMVNGFAGGGANVGGIAQVVGRSDGGSEIALYNPTATSTSVTLTAYRNDGTTGTQVVTLPARSRASVDVSSPSGLNIGDATAATVLYNAGTIAVAAQYTSIPQANRNVVSPAKADGVATMFRSGAPTQVAFAGAYNPTLTGTGYRETVSIFNPFASESVGVRVQYIFSDGTALDAANVPVLARRRVEVSTLNQPTILAKINSGAAFRSYTIVVTSSTTVPGAAGPTPGLVSLLRDDPRTGTSVMAGGSDASERLSLSAPLLIGSAPGGIVT